MDFYRTALMMNPTTDKTKFVGTVDPASAAPEMLARGVIHASRDGDKAAKAALC
jgi:hypothetical protein